MAKILITDDSEFMRELISEILTPAGHVCSYAESGEELLNKYHIIRPDVVLLDIVMMGMDGMMTLDKLMADYPDARVLICSAIAGQESVTTAAIKKGACGFIAKPFSSDNLIKQVEEALK